MRVWSGKRRILVSGGCVLTALVVLVFWLGYFELFEVKLHDWFFRRRPPCDRIIDELVIVEVSDHCVDVVGQWPWPRRIQADLIRRIAQLGAKVVGVDFLYYDPAPEASEDEAFRDALRGAGNVHLACEIRSRIEFFEIDGRMTPADSFHLQLPILPFREAARGVGLVNVDFTHDNVDGILRRIPLGRRIEQQFVPSLSLAVVADYWDTSFETLADGTVHFPALNYALPAYPSRFPQGSRSSGGLSEPSFDNSVYLNFAEYTKQGSFHVILASDLVSGDYLAHTNLIEGRIVLVGLNQGGQDLALTPYGQFPGLYVHANLVQNILEKSLIRRVSLSILTLLIVTVGAVTVTVVLSFSLLPALVFIVVAVGGWLALCYWTFVRHLTLVDVVPVFATIISVVVFLELLEATLDLRKRMKNLTSLHELGRSFNAVLNLSELADLVMRTYQDLSGATGAVLVSMTEGGESAELEQTGVVPDWLLVSLGRKGNQREILLSLSQSLKNLRLEDVAGLEVERFGRETVVFTPLVHHDGAAGWLCLVGEQLSSALLDPDERDYWLALSSVVRNALENARLYKLATIDGLTNLYVRHFFDIAIEREFRRAIRYDADLALLVTDVDKFKVFNDRYGHQLGDRVLRMVATEVKNCVRNVDIPARYGGEEFAIILPETPPAGACLIAERIRARIEALRIDHHGEELRITISIGVAATKVTTARSPAQFIKEADEALYRAKDGGRNQVRIHGEDILGKEPDHGRA